MKYAHYDDNFKLLGWYDKDIHLDIPIPYIELTDAQWKVAVTNRANYIDIETNEVVFKDDRNEEEIIKNLQDLLINKFNKTIIYELTINNNRFSTHRDDILKYKEATDTAELLNINVGLYTLDNKISLTIIEARDVIKQLTEKAYNDYWKIKNFELEVKALNTLEQLNNLIDSRGINE